MFTLMKLIPFRVHWIYPKLDYDKKNGNVKEILKLLFSRDELPFLL